MNWFIFLIPYRGEWQQSHDLFWLNFLFRLLHVGVGETKDLNNQNQDPSETKDHHNIDNMKRAAVTALSSAAVKAKLLADQEEDQIRQLATLLIQKQV